MGRDYASQRIEKNVKSFREVQDIIKHISMCILGIPEGEEGEGGAEKIFKEIMAKNFPNLLKSYYLCIQEAQQTPSRINAKRSTDTTEQNAESQRQERKLENSKRKMTHYLQITSSKINSCLPSKNKRDQKAMR